MGSVPIFYFPKEECRVILKLVILIGLFAYFLTEKNYFLSLLAIGGIVPYAGLLVSILLAGILIAQKYYISASILSTLIAWNLIGNHYLEKFRQRKFSVGTSFQANNFEKQKNIVLVDDEDSIHLLYDEEFKEKLGDEFTFVHFLCAEDALESFQYSTPDLIISCIHMPGMNGIDFLIECKKTYPEVPFIINSAHQGFEADLATWPCDAYVVKSSNLTELFNQIRRLLSLRKSQPPPAKPEA